MSDNQELTAQQQAMGQQSPRMPNLDPQIYALLNEIDTFLARTPLTRTEQNQCANCMQAIVRRLEADKLNTERLTARAAELDEELASLRNRTAAAKAVNDALEEPRSRSLVR